MQDVTGAQNRSFLLIMALIMLFGASRLPANAQGQATSRLTAPELLDQIGSGVYAVDAQVNYLILDDNRHRLQCGCSEVETGRVRFCGGDC